MTLCKCVISFWKELQAVQMCCTDKDYYILSSNLNFIRVSHCTWLPPMLWQVYMIIGLSPWLFSPTSRQLCDPEFLICYKHKHEITVRHIRGYVTCVIYHIVDLHIKKNGNVTYTSKQCWV